MFDIKKHLIKVQGGRQYLPVAARLIWFRTDHPDWGIETKPVTIDVTNQFAIFEASVYNAEGRLMAKGTKMENIKGFGDWLEKAETGAIGRALAVCGYGTQFAPDLDESHGASEAHVQYGGYRSDRSTYDARPSNSNSESIVSNAEGLALVESGFSKDTETDKRITTENKSPEQNEQCESCCAALKPSQLSLSLRKFGSALCPDCQRKRKAEQAA